MTSAWPVNTAAQLGADVISNSYGGDEYRGTLPLERKYYTHPGVAQVAASGDFGFGPAQFPASGSTMIGVGGTSLSQKDGVWKERAWWGAGSGCSAWIDKPAWQHDGHCPTRMVADVSAVADPGTGFAVYDTFGLGRHNGWIVVGGTSLSSPLIAGMIGLAGNARSARLVPVHLSAPGRARGRGRRLQRILRPRLPVHREGRLRRTDRPREPARHLRPVADGTGR